MKTVFSNAAFIMPWPLLAFVLFVGIGLSAIFYKTSSNSHIEHADVSCKVQTLERFTAVVAVMDCQLAGKTVNTRTNSTDVVIWAWENRERALRCDLNSANSIVACRL